MSDLVMASTHQDAAATARVQQHHAELSGALGLHVEALVSAAARGDRAAATAATADLLVWCGSELLPHARAEEEVLYPAAQGLPEGRLLVAALRTEHDLIDRVLRAVGVSTDPVRAAASAAALRVLVECHVAKENDLLLPLLAESPRTSLGDLVDAMHAALPVAGSPSEASQAGASPSTSGGCGGHTCGCGEESEPGYPELDVRAVPHAIRHATVFGALESVRPGGGLELVAHHDPLPLLAQVEHRFSGVFVRSYRERGPEVWRIVFERRSADSTGPEVSDLSVVSS